MPVFHKILNFFSPDFVPEKVKNQVVNEVLNMPEFTEGSKITVNYLVSKDSIFRIEYMEINKVEYYDLVSERLTNIKKDDLNNPKNRGTLNIPLGRFRDLPSFYGEWEQPYHDIYLKESRIYSEFNYKHVDWGYSSHHFEHNSWKDCDGNYVQTTQKITLMTRRTICCPNTLVTYKCEFPNVANNYNNKYFENRTIPVDNNAGVLVDFRIDFTPANIAGNGFICLNEQVPFSLNSIYCPGSSVSWSSSSNLSYISGQGTNYYKVRAIGNSNGWVQANINGAVFRKDVRVGPKADISGDSYVSYPGSGNWYANSSCANNYDWYLKREDLGGFVSVQHSSLSQLSLNSVLSKSKKPVPEGEPNFFLFVRVSNGSGGYSESPTTQIIANGDVDLVLGSGGGGLPPIDFSLSPNPATDFIFVELDDVAPQENKNIQNTVRLLDKDQKVIFQQITTEKQITINVSNLQSGVYFLQVFNDSNMKSKKVVIMD